jgi:hypothetical protein
MSRIIQLHHASRGEFGLRLPFVPIAGSVPVWGRNLIHTKPALENVLFPIKWYGIVAYQETTVWFVWWNNKAVAENVANTT